MYNNVATQLISILQAVTSLNAVYDGEQKELANYPAACVSFVGHTNRINDTGGNRRTVSYMIRIYYRSADATDAEQTVRNVADDVLEALEANVTLNGACDWATATAGKGFYAERELPVRGIEITLDANLHVLR